MNETVVFENKTFGSIRTLIVDGRPYWVAIDVTRILGYANNHNAVTSHCHEVLKQNIVDARGRRQEVYIISESDLYRLVTHSKLQKAKKFERWVFEEVLPAIRRTGQYKTQENKKTELDEIRQGIIDIKNILTGGDAKQKQSRVPHECSVRTLNLLRVYISAMLDLIESQQGIQKSQILHGAYKHLEKQGYDLAELKAEYIASAGITYCSQLDAIIYGDAETTGKLNNYLQALICV